MYISKNHVRLVVFGTSAVFVILVFIIGMLCLTNVVHTPVGISHQASIDADNAATAAEKAAISARKTAESTKQTADSAANSAKDATKSAKDASVSSDVRQK